MSYPLGTLVAVLRTAGWIRPATLPSRGVRHVPGGAVDDTDALDEARSAFYAAASSAHWRVYDWYVDKILDDALEAGALLADA